MSVKKTAKSSTVLGDLSSVYLPFIICNAVYSVYVLNYTPKVGAVHVRLCAGIGGLMVLFTLWAVICCIRLIVRSKAQRVLTVFFLGGVVLGFLLWLPATCSYWADFVNGSRTVTTDRYLPVSGDLYFTDEDGQRQKLTLPDAMFAVCRENENNAYDAEENYLIYSQKVKLIYYPHSKVIVSAEIVL